MKRYIAQLIWNENQGITPGTKEHEYGEYVKYSDHKAVVETLTKEASHYRNKFYDMESINAELENKIEELTTKLIEAHRKYCPEVAGYSVDYKYVHENCNGNECDKCWRDQIAKGLE